MLNLKIKLFAFLKVIILLCVILLGVLYYSQERILFFPQKLGQNYKFEFEQPFEELKFKITNNKQLHGLLFKTNNSKGLIFYLHGNAGSVNSWGHIAKTYTDLNYDIFILDYRGYGKSEGEIKSQEQLFYDNQLVYDSLKEEYSENNIVIIGYSIGTGLASKLASENNPKQLILQAPYYSLTDVMKHKFLIIPEFILRYKLETNEYLKNCNTKTTIFHGIEDNVIYYGSSLKLMNDFKNKIRLISLDNQGHNGITNNKEYKKELKGLLD